MAGSPGPRGIGSAPAGAGRPPAPGAPKGPLQAHFGPKRGPQAGLWAGFRARGRTRRHADAWMDGWRMRTADCALAARSRPRSCAHRKTAGDAGPGCARGGERRADGRTDGRTDGWMDGWSATDGGGVIRFAATAVARAPRVDGDAQAAAVRRGTRPLTHAQARRKRWLRPRRRSLARSLARDRPGRPMASDDVDDDGGGGGGGRRARRDAARCRC
eukprot:scaffold704_cov347-Prasinococcus_capsulatus_cf.AAC.8